MAVMVYWGKSFTKLGAFMQAQWQRIKIHAVSLKVWLVLLIIFSVLIPLGIFALGTSLLDAYNKRLPVVDYKEGEVVSPKDAVWLTLKGDVTGGFFTIKQKHVGVNSWQYHLFNDYLFIPMFVLSFLSVVAVVWLFYRWKLQKPLKILSDGMAHIRRQDLNFTVHYHSRDELGELCEGFETMRAQLDTTFKELWDSQAMQRELVQAFAHDLRTPLTVLKGYTGILALQADRDTLQPEKIKQNTRMMQENITRMERYLDAMREMRSLEEWALSKVPVDVTEFANRLREQYGLLAEVVGKSVTVTTSAEGTVSWDTALVSRVLDNLTANALQHAARAVHISLTREAETIIIRVEDDGKGFTPEAQQRAFEAFYRGNAARSGAGMGLGLSIARSLA
ncbi:MAG: HAMP domain-containing histidine kinase, partial [Gorillibacterium sp.]|nr:HAMP domain-containing histidine kinase [Gorillibacterium sp.]